MKEVNAINHLNETLLARLDAKAVEAVAEIERFKRRELENHAQFVRQATGLLDEWQSKLA